MLTFDLFSEAGVFEIPVWDSPLPEVVEAQAPKGPAYSEKKELAGLLAGRVNAVIVQRLKRKCVSIIPQSPMAAALLVDYGWSQPWISNSAIVKCPLHDTVLASDGRIHLLMDDFLSLPLEQSKGYKTLLKLGLDPVFSPSLRGWIPREVRRRQVELTPFLLEEVEDQRPLVERCEPGLVLECVADSGSFKAGEHYIVIHVPTVTEEAESPVEEEGEENEETEEACAETLYVELCQFDPNIVDKQQSQWGGSSLQWSVADSMEGVFIQSGGGEKIYDPAKCVPALYPERFQANLDRLNVRFPQNSDLFKHTRFDVAQAGLSRNYLCGKPMRMGKSRESLAFAWLRNSKRVAFVTEKNVREFVVEDDLKPLGFTDFKVVNRHRDLAPREKQPWLELLTSSWVKGGKKDPINRQTSYHCEKEADCPHCGQLLARPILRKLFSGMKVGVSWTTEFGYLCANPACSYASVSHKRTSKAEFGASWQSESPAQHGAGIASMGPLADVGQGADPGNTAPAAFGLTRYALKDIGSNAVPRTLVKSSGFAMHVEHSRSETEFLQGSGYVDYQRKMHVMHFAEKNVTAEHSDSSDVFHGRQCKGCGFVEQAWVPSNVRRLKKRYTLVIWDELHKIKAGLNSEIGVAALGLTARSQVGLTGTLIPNTPSDAYWQLHWLFGNGTHQFPYQRRRLAQHEGFKEFNQDYTSTIEVETNSKAGTYSKRLPFLKCPVKFWKFLSDKMIRRTWKDQLVVESLAEAGLMVTEATVVPLRIEPDPQQAKLMAASIDQFQNFLAEYKKELEEKSIETGVIKQINNAMIMTRMYRMQKAATMPDLFNAELKKKGIDIPIYTGVTGGGKMKQIFDICASRIQDGGKVVVLSNFRPYQMLLEKELGIFNPIRFLTSGNEKKRKAQFNLFRDDPNRNVFIAGPFAIGLGVDLSAANTCICTDLIWTPGPQQQAWNRIVKPLPFKRECDVFLTLTRFSVDEHIYDTFYAKSAAASQALDRAVLKQADKKFDIEAFIDKVVGDRTRLVSWMEEQQVADVDYLPLIELFSREERIA